MTTAELSDAEGRELLERILRRHPLAESEVTSSTGGELSPAEIAWLIAAQGAPQRRPRVARLAMTILDRRADLQHSFPEPLERSRLGLAYWYATWGRAEYGLERELVAPVLASLPAHCRLRARLWWRRYRWRTRSQRGGKSARVEASAGFLEPPATQGINLIGWLDGPTGVAQACRGSLAALEAAGLEVAVGPLDDLPELPSPAWAERFRHNPLAHPVNLYHVNADMMDFVRRRLPPEIDRGRHRVGFWFWELARFPRQLRWALSLVDEVWAPSRFCQAALAADSPVEVHLVPPCVPPPQPAETPVRGSDREGTFVFLSSFDARSIAPRKNPFGLIDAFGELGRRVSRPVLLELRVVHPDADPQLLSTLEHRVRGKPVSLVARDSSRQEYLSALASADAYVSLHRSEGLGLALIEAMYLGKPVIATGYGGCTDFLDQQTGWPVRYTLTPLGRPYGPYPAEAEWAEPDLAHATEQMLAVVEHPEEAAVRTERARSKVEGIYSPAAAGERFRARLARILGGA